MKRALFLMPRAALASQTDSCGMESALHVMRPALNEVVSMRLLPVLLLSALALAACGSSGGTSTPPAPPAPVTPPAPPPPPPEPTFEERLADLAAFDPNPCRAETPGFEALGGWLKNDGREIGASRVWLRDSGDIDGPLDMSHGARVNASFSACAARDIARYVRSASIRTLDGSQNLEEMLVEADLSHGLLISSSYSQSGLANPGTDALVWFNLLDADSSDLNVMLITGAGNGNNLPTGLTQGSEYKDSLNEALKPDNLATALWILVGGYSGEGEDRAPARDVALVDGGVTGSSLCGDADALCLFAPWRVEGRTDSGTKIGTSHATPQVSAALDTVWAVWPDMDILDLRNLAFDCAEDMAAPEGETATTRSYSYKNGRSFTSDTNSTWGHGILSMTCLFTPNGGLQNPVTGNAVSGGIYGPMAGPITGASITGVDYTGRDFGYGFARPVARENFALAATANLSAVQPFSGRYASAYASGAFRGNLWGRSSFRVDLTAVGNAIGATAGWRLGDLTLQGGLAAQPEGVGSLTGSRAFRAPSTLSAGITAAYGKALAYGFSAHVQADYWRTLVTRGRSLWEGANFRESRFTAALVKRAGTHEFSLHGAWRSGLSGTLRVDGRYWGVSPQAESGVWLMWRQMR